MVIELPQPYAISSVAVDNTGTQEGGYPGISGRAVTVYGSTTSAPEGFSQLAAVEAGQGGRKKVSLSSLVTAHWLKFAVNLNWGNTSYAEIMKLEAYGPR